MHLITPIHKSGDKTTVKLYQPISLHCVVSKAFERIVYDKIIYYKFIGAPPYKQFLIFLTSVYNCLNDKTQMDVVYLDFRKAFDSVPHNQLLSTLWTVERFDKEKCYH